MAHFEAKKHGKTIESPKSNVVKGQMSAIVSNTLTKLGKGKMCQTKITFLG